MFKNESPLYISILKKWTGANPSFKNIKNKNKNEIKK